MTAKNDSPSITDLFRNAVNQLGKLVHNEVLLARAELSQKLNHAGKGAAFVAASAIVLIPTLVVLLISAALFLVQFGLSAAAAYLTVAAAGAVISVILALVGMNQLTAEKLKPKVTLQQLECDLHAVKEITR